MTKFSNNEYVLWSLVKVCRVLSCDIGDIMKLFCVMRHNKMIIKGRRYDRKRI
jgi:hypothetical protein